jgi:small subunit ribosomal protein S6
MLMLDPELADERQTEIVTRARELVEGGGGAWEGQESWGRRRLAYEIDKKTEAHYHLLHFDCEPATLDELTRILKITDGAMRHMAVRRPAGSVLGRTPAPPPEPVSAPAVAEAEPEAAAAPVVADPEPASAATEAEAAEPAEAAASAPEPEPESAPADSPE